MGVSRLAAGTANAGPDAYGISRIESPLASISENVGMHAPAEPTAMVRIAARIRAATGDAMAANAELEIIDARLWGAEKAATVGYSKEPEHSPDGSVGSVQASLDVLFQELARTGELVTRLRNL